MSRPITRRELLHASPAAVSLVIGPPRDAWAHLEDDGWFNVRDYGAAGDGVRDDAGAIQTAIEGAAGRGVCYLPAGVYSVGRAVEVPFDTIVCGAGARNTIIRWAGPGEPEGGVVTSNIGGAGGVFTNHLDGFAVGTSISNLAVEANGAARGMLLLGWNEACLLDRVEIWGAREVGLDIGPVAQPATNITQHAAFRGLRIVPPGGAVGIRLRDVRRCTFDNVTVDILRGQTEPARIGWEFVEGVIMNSFREIHVENCSLGLDIGTVGQCFGNVWLGLDFHCPEVVAVAPPDLDPPGTTAIRVRGTGTKHYTILSLRDEYGYDWLLHDAAAGRFIAGRGGGAGLTSEMFVIASLHPNGEDPVFLNSATVSTFVPPEGGGPASGAVGLGRMRRLAEGDPRPSVAGGNVFELRNASAVDVVDFSGAVSGQEITILFSTDNTSLRSVPGQLHMRDGRDVTPPAGGVVRLMRMGDVWYELARSFGRSA